MPHPHNPNRNLQLNYKKKKSYCHKFQLFCFSLLVAGSTLEAMAQAVERASMVIICMTQKYKESPSCRTGKYKPDVFSYYGNFLRLIYLTMFQFDLNFIVTGGRVHLQITEGIYTSAARVQIQP